MNKLSIGSCFSGIGGLELGLEWTGGFETKWQIEMDEYATRVLEKHWPNVKRYSDIRDVVRPEPVDLICGGFPCQDVSLAGKRAGLEGKRSTLWGEMFRLVCEVRPKWVVAENVPGLLSSDNGQFFGNILRDLASTGYDAEWGVLSACECGAPHRRRRVFLLAYSNSDRHLLSMPHRRTKEINRQREEGFWGSYWNEVGAGYSGNEPIQSLEETKNKVVDKPWLLRVVDGVSKSMDGRIKCLGNAVVPQVAQKIGETILAGVKAQKRFEGG